MELLWHQLVWTSTGNIPFIRAQRLGELIGQLRSSVDVEVSQEYKSAVLGVLRHGSNDHVLYKD